MAHFGMAVACGALFGAIVAAHAQVGPMRVAAEWEPVETVIIRSPWAHEPEAVIALHQAAGLTILVQDASEEAYFRGYFQSTLGIDPATINWVTTTDFSIWPRDWGPYCAFDSTGEMFVVDPMWQGYPSMNQPCGGGISIWTPSQDDATANAEIAASLGLSRSPMPAYATGGNFLLDGFGRGFSSCLQLAENAPINSESQLRGIVDSYMGISDYQIMQNWELSGIQHVDCWMKLADEETILVKRPPAGHPEEGPTEANIAVLESLLTPWGRPYRIIRVDTPPYNGQGHLANYLNSLIINDHVLVPMFNTWADQAALDAFGAALPGYTVVPLPFSGEYNYTDAVHCRSRSIFDRDMLRLTHAPMRGDVPHQPGGYPLVLQVESMGGHTILAGETQLRWRETGDTDWNVIALTDSGGGSFAGVIPGDAGGVERGDTVEYYIRSADSSGRISHLPYPAPDGFYSFEVYDDRLTLLYDMAPSLSAPGDPISVRIRVEERQDALVPGSVFLQYSYEAGAAAGEYATLQMTDLGGGIHEAVIPGGRCGELVSVYASADSPVHGERMWPRDGASDPFTVEVGASEMQAQRVESLDDGLPADMTATGLWSVSGACPAPAGGCGGGLSAAFVDSASCTYNTGATEQGDLTLTVDLTSVHAGESATLTYCSFLHTEQTDYGFLGYDIATVLANGIPIDSPEESLAWLSREVDLSAFAGSSVTLAWRFDTVDNEYNDYPGWRVDDIRVEVEVTECNGGPCAGDANGDGFVDFGDLDAVLLRWGQSVAPGSTGDVSRDGTVNYTDLNEVLSNWAQSCS